MQHTARQTTPAPSEHRQAQRESILEEAATVKDMATRVISNGGEPAYATEKLWRAFKATVRALIDDLDSDPRELIKAIERETR